MEQVNPIGAFNNAISNGTLSDNQDSPAYAGHYMYMHTDSKGDHFKHITTRQYIVSRR